MDWVSWYVFGKVSVFRTKSGFSGSSHPGSFGSAERQPLRSVSQASNQNDDQENYYSTLNELVVDPQNYCGRETSCAVDDAFVDLDR